MTTLENILSYQTVLLTSGSSRAVLLQGGLRWRAATRVTLMANAGSEPYCSVDFIPGVSGLEQLTPDQLDHNLIIGIGREYAPNKFTPRDIGIYWNYQPVPLVKEFYITIGVDCGTNVSITLVKQGDMTEHPLARLRPSAFPWLHVSWWDPKTGHVDRPSVFPEDDVDLDPRDEDADD